MTVKSRCLICVISALHCVAILATVTASAGEPKHPLLHELLGCSVPDCIGKWCCDDYCPKQEPCVCAPLCFGCDDYCNKKAPCVCVPLCFGCDDYCKKCPPTPCSSPLCQFLRCGPRRAPCGCDNCVGSGCDVRLAQKTDVDEQTSRDEKSQDLNTAAATEFPSIAPVIVYAPDLKELK